MGKKRNFFPREAGDKVSFTFMTVIIHMVALYELFVVLPYIDSDRTKTFWLHAGVGFFIYLNIMYSFVKLILTNSSTAGEVLPTLLIPGWRYCSQCETNSPPRSSHCWICDLCVIRRDHHCTFAGNCVGHKNQRYFFSLLFYLMVGAIYCNFLNVDYTLEVLGGMTVTTVLTMILPMLSWAMNYSGALGFIVSFMSATCLVSSLLLIFLLIYHFINLLKGQTCSERNSNDKTYDLGSWSLNAKASLGEKWWFYWIFPMLTQDDQSSGFNFKTSSEKHYIKQM